MNRMIPEILQSLPPANEVYLVGGSVRDMVMGRVPADHDLVTAHDPEGYARKIASALSGSFVKLGKPGQWLFRVVKDQICLDVCGFNGSSLETDLSRRDFTVNAMAYDLKQQQIIDLFGGIQDISHKQIRRTAEDVFVQDPVRLLRAFRFAAALKFHIESGTLSAIKEQARLIAQSAGERIRTELFKMMAADRCFSSLLEMADSGLLFVILPEMSSLKGCLQNRHHAFDALEHSLRAFENLENLLFDPPDENDVKKLVSTFDPEKKSLLKLAVLLHDMAKPQTRSIDESGNVHFYEHEKKGAERVEIIGARMKWAARETRFVSDVIRHHLRPLLLFREETNGNLSQRGLTRFFMKCGELVPYLLIHAIADHRAKAEEKEDAGFESFIGRIFGVFSSDFRQKSALPRLLTGHDLQEKLGLSPSPQFKKILDAVEESRLSGKISSQEEALELVKEMLKPQPGGSPPGCM